MTAVVPYIESETAMSTPAEMLQLYREASNVTGDILARAQSGDWDEVVHLGDAYLDIIRRIRDLGPVPPLGDEDRASKHALLVRILDNNARTQSLARPGLQRLGELIGTMKRQQTLANAYGQPVDS